ncbi:hypothetical protein BT69DRAFT_124983 [Atractiella rhizophila]|nr:hypothetical protein BT69DRAFT_124983 [Atractiella rhizophila]
MLFHLGEREGNMTKIRERLVSNHMLSWFATCYDLPSQLELTPANEHLRNREKQKADVFESYIGAVHLYRGEQTCTTWLRDLMLPYALEINDWLAAQGPHRPCTSTTVTTSASRYNAYGTFPRTPMPIAGTNKETTTKTETTFHPITLCGLRIPFLFSRRTYQTIPETVTDCDTEESSQSLEGTTMLSQPSNERPTLWNIAENQHAHQRKLSRASAVSFPLPIDGAHLSPSASPFVPTATTGAGSNSASDQSTSSLTPARPSLSSPSHVSNPAAANEATLFVQDPVAFLRQHYRNALKFEHSSQGSGNNDTKTWTTNIFLGLDKQKISSGTGRNKKEASRIAAEHAVEALKLVTPAADKEGVIAEPMDRSDTGIASNPFLETATSVYLNPSVVPLFPSPTLWSISPDKVQKDPPGTFYRLSLCGASPKGNSRPKFFFWIMNDGRCWGFGSGHSKAEAERKARGEMTHNIQHDGVSLSALRHITPRWDDSAFKPDILPTGTRSPDAYQELYRVFGIAQDEVKRLVFIERPPEWDGGNNWTVKVRLLGTTIGEGFSESRSQARILASEIALRTMAAR